MVGDYEEILAALVDSDVTLLSVAEWPVSCMESKG